MPWNGTPLRAAFIGTGNMARTHLGALQRVRTGHVVTGVFDVSLPAAESFAAATGPQARAYPTLASLLVQARPQIVHVCTPAGTHYEAARQALLSGAHVYVEKPFVETSAEAEALFDLAQERRLLICAGHQLLREGAFEQLLQRADELGPITHVDSYFAFHSPTLTLYRAAPPALANQLLDILPHPLYTLLAALERVRPAAGPPELVAVSATPADIHALIRQGGVMARLYASLRARPVTSTLSVTGGGGTLTADFVRGMLIGAGNEGTSPLEKMGNPLLEGGQLLWRTTASLIRRFTRGGGCGGLTELLDSLYGAVARGELNSPLPVEHLRTVTMVYEELAAALRLATATATACASLPSQPAADAPLAVLTGASGFLGREIARELSRRGFRVRGIGRSARPDLPGFDDWVRADLGHPLPVGALDDADVVVHAAAETMGGFAAHRRNTVDATKHVLAAMVAAGVRRLVLVSSLSVIEPPHLWGERQDEGTPLAERPNQLGPYTWGKCVAEQLVAAARDEGRIDARIVRPGALFDADHVELPGLLGRRLFGRWHLGLGRAGLPLPVCEVRRAGAVLAWCADQFDSAPAVLNLFDPEIATRGELLASWRERGWSGRVVWAPIIALAGLLVGARFAQAALRRQRPEPLAAWSVLRPRRFDPTLSRLAVAAAAANGDRPRRVSPIPSAAES